MFLSLVEIETWHKTIWNFWGLESYWPQGDGVNRLTWSRLELNGRIQSIHKSWQITLKEKKNHLDCDFLILYVLNAAHSLGCIYVNIQKKTVMTNLQVQVWTRFALLWVFNMVTLAWSLSDVISSAIESKNIVKHVD